MDNRADLNSPGIKTEFEEVMLKIEVPEEVDVTEEHDPFIGSKTVADSSTFCIGAPTANEEIKVNSSPKPEPQWNLKEKPDDNKNLTISNANIFKCNICHQSFDQRSLFKKHMLRHKSSKHKCPECGKIAHLRTHEPTQIYEKETFQCKICKVCFVKRSSFVNHMSRHENLTNKCCKCAKFVDCLDSHTEICAKERPFRCRKCKRCFTQKSNLTTHLKAHEGKKLFKCHMCNRSYRQNAGLQSHMLKHLGQKSFQCNQCQKCYWHQISLRKHMQTHKFPKQFECEICRETFSTKCELKEHFVVHTGQQLYRCDVCEGRFVHKKNFERHMSVVHAGHKPFQCDRCSKLFASKSNLERHMLIHDNRKPYQCDKCQKGYSQKLDLKNHVVAVHCSIVKPVASNS